MKKRITSFRALAFGAALLAQHLTLLAADEAGFTPLFNGKDLSGWEGNPKLWSVQDGAITGKTGNDPDNKLTHNTFLVWTNGTVENFEMRLSYKMIGGNSGIQYRSKVIEQGKFGPIVSGYQADFEAGKTYSGILYEERARGILAQRGQKTVIKADGEKHKVEVVGSLGNTDDIQAKIKQEDWNDYVVLAEGNHLRHFINGVQTVDVVDEDSAHAAKSGVLALQIHQGPPMTVQFKNIRIKKLSGSAKNDLDALQGNWRPVELIGNGDPAGAELLSTIKLSIKGKDYIVKTNDNDDGGSFEIFESQQPKRMDVTTRNGDSVPAIYELSGDTLRVCYAINDAARPTEFKSAAGSSHILATYKRVQP